MFDPAQTIRQPATLAGHPVLNGALQFLELGVFHRNTYLVDSHNFSLGHERMVI